jgi:hypothetical protein
MLHRAAVCTVAAYTPRPCSAMATLADARPLPASALAQKGAHAAAAALRCCLHCCCLHPSPLQCNLTRRACRPRALVAGYLCARSPRLPPLGRCRHRACRPRALVARYLCARSPRLPPLGRRRRRACCPRASVAGYLCARSPRLPSLGRRRRRACRHCASVAGYLLSPLPSLPPLGCATVAFFALAPQLSVTCAPAPLSCARLLFHFSSTKRKEIRGAAMQDTQVAIRIEQQTTHNIDPRITRSMRSKLESRCRLV